MKHIELPIESVRVPDTRVTSYFDSEVYEQFKNTIAQVGVLEPIVVVEVGEEYFLVDGLHRLVESQERGDATISAVVIPGEEKDVFLTNLFLNVLRGKPRVGEIREVVELLSGAFKLETKQICEKTGLTESYVNDLLSVSRLPEEVQIAFDDGRLAKGKALALAKLPTPELQLRVFYQIDGRDLTVEAVEGIVAVVLEELGKQVTVATRTRDPAERRLECGKCHQEHALSELKQVFICAECEALLSVKNP
jgi:ParB family chromosome partitioning protein